MIKKYHIIGQTDRGAVRPANEDHILVGRMVKNRGRTLLRMEGDDDFLNKYGLLFAVADGVGGLAGGAEASRLGLTLFDHEYYQIPNRELKVSEAADILR